VFFISSKRSGEKNVARASCFKNFEIKRLCLKNKELKGLIDKKKFC
jgi:hypothetical protein